jgi:AraC-like DNA-binding protein
MTIAPEFHIMEQHNQARRDVPGGGKVVLSQLPRGTSLIGAPAASLKLVLDGEENYEVDGRIYRVEPGQFLYLESGVDCLGHNRRETKGMCLLLPPARHARVPQREEWLLPRALVLPVRTSPAGRTLETYAREIAKWPVNGGRLAPDLLARIDFEMNELVADVTAAMARLDSTKASTRSAVYQRLERARAFLHDTPDRNVSLAELSACSGVSQFHFARYFKAAFGAAPIAYHREIRLRHAAQLLKAGMPPRGVAAAAGYSDQVAFTHAFRRHFGLSPGKWARRLH